MPLEETADGKLAIAIADPSQLMMIDEIGLLLQKPIITKVATLKQIDNILTKTEQSQRVLEEASEGFQIIREDENTGAERNPDHRQADGRGRFQPDYPAGRYYDFYRAAEAGLRYTHRNPG